MKTRLENIKLEELASTELNQIFGGGQAAGVAYNLVYVTITTNPVFWLAKYDEAVINAIF